MVLNAHTRSRKLKDLDELPNLGLSHPSRLTFAEQVKFTELLSVKNFELLRNFISYREDLTADSDQKMKKLVTYLLQKIYDLNQQQFRFIGEALNIIDPQDDSENSEKLQSKTKIAKIEKQDTQKSKDQIKKKKTNLMAKFKSK